MASKFQRKLLRTVRSWLKNRTFVLVVFILVFCVGVIGYTNFIQNRRLTVDPATYKPLLDLIAKAESKGNYNAYFGNAGNTAIDFTKMSITEVQKWQADYISQGNASSAIGRYQIVNTTLEGLINRLSIDPNQKFDQSTQDAMAIALLERRGSENYLNNELTREEFAANLAKEWAGLPKVIGEKPSESYYAGDGLNKSRVSVDDVLKAIEPISPQ